VAALKAIRARNKEFTRGRFGETRNSFAPSLDKYFQFRVAARARTYLAVADARLRTESILPRDADSPTIAGHRVESRRDVCPGNV